MIRKICFYSFLLSVLSYAFPVFADTMSNVYSSDHLSISVSKIDPEFTIQLKSNPTTGYSWFLRQYNADLVDPIGHYFQVPHTKMIGAPGIEVFRFRMKPAAFVVPQHTALSFVYARPWVSTENTTTLVFRVSTRGD